MPANISPEFLQKIENEKSDKVPQFSEVGLDNVFEMMVDDYAGLTAQIKKLEEHKEELAQDISALLEASDCPKCYAAGNKVMLRVMRRGSLDEMALIEHGVPKSIIEKCKKFSTSVSIWLYKIKRES